MNIFQYTLYIFDLDGVIINSEPHHWKSYQHALKVCNLSNNQELTYKTYCKLKHSIDHNISFEHTYKEQYTQIYNEKKRHYYNNIDNVTLIDGFEDFLNTLLLKNKTVCLVTDSSKNGLNIIINKFPILKKIHYIVTRDDVKDRKPSSEGYLKVLNKCSNIGLSEIIGFEDSYKGFTALYRVVKNAVLVNNENYFYFDKIKPQLNMGYIYDYKNINNIYMTDKHVLDYLVISASGKGSRLLPLTAHIPKLLVTYNNNSLLNNIVSYWKNYTKKFVIIINEKYNTLVEFYLNMLDIEYEIINVELVNNYENSYTLHKALSHNRFLHKKILITWCDIYPKNKLSKETDRAFSEGNEKYLLSLDNVSYPLLSELDENSYDVFSSKLAKSIHAELLNLRSCIGCKDAREHINELCRLAFKAANESGAMLVFTPFLE